MKLKYSGTNDGVVYYLVAFITTVTLITYIYAGEVIPLVGFLLASSLIFALYPNKSIALVSGILVAAMLRTSKEGMDPAAKKEKDPKEKHAVKQVENMVSQEQGEVNPAQMITDAMNAAKNVDKDLSVESTKSPYENKGAAKITPMELNKDMSSKDMEQLSNIIDKTTDLIKMLPEGFLAKA